MNNIDLTRLLNWDLLVEDCTWLDNSLQAIILIQLKDVLLKDLIGGTCRNIVLGHVLTVCRFCVGLNDGDK